MYSVLLHIAMYTMYMLLMYPRCRDQVADKARGKAKCFIMQWELHTECYKSSQALLAYFNNIEWLCRWMAGLFNFHFSNCVICKLIGWFSIHSEEWKKMDYTPPPPAKRLSLSLMKNNSNSYGSFIMKEEQATTANDAVPVNTKFHAKTCTPQQWRMRCSPIRSYGSFTKGSTQLLQTDLHCSAIVKSTIVLSTLCWSVPFNVSATLRT